MTNVIRYDKNNCHSEGSATTEESLGMMNLRLTIDLLKQRDPSLRSG